MQAPLQRSRSRAQPRLPRIVCVVGATSSGKTALSLRLAREIHGEIINADSRQIYKDIGIGTGKPEGKRGTSQGRRAFLVEGIPHYLMDVLDPRQSFTVVEWRDKALRAMKSIVKRGKIPILVGGTGLYIASLVDNFAFPRVEPNAALRTAFEAKPLHELVHLLLKLDPAAAQVVDLKNPRRVIRALEVATFTGKPFTAQKRRGNPLVESFQVGIAWTREQIYERVNAEIDQMIARGWVEEIRSALAKGIPEDAPAMTSIGYREFVEYIKGKRTLEQAVEAAKRAVRQYAKRQYTWFKRDSRIYWAANEEEAVRQVKKWLATG